MFSEPCASNDSRVYLCPLYVRFLTENPQLLLICQASTRPLNDAFGHDKSFSLFSSCTLSLFVTFCSSISQFMTTSRREHDRPSMLSVIEKPALLSPILSVLCNILSSSALGSRHLGTN